MSAKTAGGESASNEDGTDIHVLTSRDVEDILLSIDTLYWRFFRLIKSRAIAIGFDPHSLSSKLFD